MKRAARFGALLLCAAFLGGSQPAGEGPPRRGGGPAAGEGAREGKRPQGMREGARPGGRQGGGPGRAGGKRSGKGAEARNEQAMSSMRAAAGNMFMRQGSPAAAAAAFRKQLQKNPDAPALNVGLGKALARMGQCDEALERLWPFVGTVPFGGDAALAAATCSSRLGLLEDAIYFDRLAVDLDPTSARALTSLALDLATAGDVAGTEAALDELLFLRPERDASLYAQAVLALRAGDIDTFDRIAFAWEVQEGASLDLRRLQSQAWLDLDCPQLALETLTKVRRTRNGVQIRHLRAESYRRSGYPDVAMSYLEDRPESVLEGADSDAVRVRVLADLGELAEAREILDGYQGDWNAELTASAWYLARAEGHADELPGLAEAYAVLRPSPLRQLDDLVPWKTAAP